MTYGVPYSFVPGTKAKADEVNANFIDVLEKIENSNTRITQLEDGKADVADNDGKWVGTSVTTLGSNISLTAGNAKLVATYDLSNYLPKDNNTYMVANYLSVLTNSTSGSYVHVWNHGNTGIPGLSASVQTRTASTMTTSVRGYTLVGANRKLYYTASVTGGGTINSIQVYGYRKVR